MVARLADSVRDIARRLRSEEKKSLQDIARILGVAKATVGHWAVQENWPNPEEEKKALVAAVKGVVAESAAAVKASAADRPPPGPPPAEKKTREKPSPEVGAELPDFTKDGLEKIAEKISRWGLDVLTNSLKANYNQQTVLRLVELGLKTWTALKAPDPDQMKTFQVFIPEPDQEVYRGPPK